jgi:hypothetical protein
MQKVMPSKTGEEENPFEGAYANYRYLVKSGKEQPLTTHADRYEYNMAYGIAAYSKGEIFLAQLGYIIGPENLMKTIKKYYADYKLTHPMPNDIKRTAEKVSGANLDWYLVDWAQTINTIDYSIESVEGNTVSLKRIGRMPMPLDILVTYEDGTIESYYVPNTLMRWEKPNMYPNVKRTVLKGWDWSSPNYSFTTSAQKIKSVVIDPSSLMADIDLKNNVYKN